MGWIILAVIVALLLTPLFVPLIVRVRLDEGVREWSVHVGPLQVAPDTQEHLQALLAKLRRVARPFVIVGRFLGSVFSRLFRMLAVLFGAIAWPFRVSYHAIRSLGRKREKGERDEFAPSPPSASAPVSPKDSTEETQAPEERATDTGDEEEDDSREGQSGSIDVPREEPPGRDFSGPEEEPGSTADSRENDSSFKSGESDTKTGGGETSADSTGPASGGAGGFDFEDTPGEEWGEEEARSSRKPPRDSSGGGFEGLRARAARIWDNVTKWRAMLSRFGPLGVKVLRAAKRLLAAFLRVPSFHRFNARWSTGGDPATLGAILGWHHALLGAVKPGAADHVVFEPDWDDEELSPRGSLDVELFVWPYRFVIPTLRFIVSVPWWGIFWAVRKQKRESRDLGPGVAA